MIEARSNPGHFDPKLTAGIYTQVGVDDLRAAVEKVGSLAGRSQRQASA